MPCMQDLRRKPKIYKGQVQIMQTIEEYQRYTRQLEGEVKKWHELNEGKNILAKWIFMGDGIKYG